MRVSGGLLPHDLVIAVCESTYGQVAGQHVEEEFRAEE